MNSKINIYISPLNTKHHQKYNIVPDERFNIIDWRDEKCEYYNWWKNNIHHWTNECTIEFGKRIAKNEEIELCKYIEEKKVFDGHTIKRFYPYRNKSYKTINISTGEEVEGNNDVLKWNILKHPKFYWGWPITGYHQTFYGAHMVSRTINTDLNNGKKVLVIADSMFIPLAPIFAGSCKELVVLDARFYEGEERFRRSDYDDIFMLCIDGNYKNVISYYDRYVIDDMDKIVVYSYVTNNINHKPWPKITYTDDNIKYVMFTDDVLPGETIRDGWELRKVETETPDMLKEDMNKFYKWHPYDNFEGYDYSLYIDSKVELLMNPIKIIRELKNKNKYGFICHKYDFSPRRYPEHEKNYDDIYKHIDYLVTAGVGNLNNLKLWKSKLEEEGYPHMTGLLECAMILTNLHNFQGKIIEDEIFRKYMEVNTVRDQVIVPYVIWKMGYDINDFNCMGNYIHKSPYAKNSGCGVNNRNYSDNRYKIGK